MKKYRCLWGKSTANHNIWYFLRTSSTSLQNLLPTHKTRAILLWKAQTALSGAVLGHTQLPKIQCNQCPQRYALQPNKPMPLKKSEQEAKQVQIWRCPVGVVDNWVPIIDRDCPTPLKVDSAASVPCGVWGHSLLPPSNGAFPGTMLPSQTHPCKTALMRGHHPILCKENAARFQATFLRSKTGISYSTSSRSSSHRTICARRTPTPGRMRLPVLP
jgi:hypothetical protein